jgi:uncharacterized membrane protein YphA (DoxX/SURF4 family)
MTKTQKIIYYILLVLVSALFLVASYAKLTGNSGAEASFTMAHLPVWFMYFIGAAELLGVIGLWIRCLQIYAATGLSIILAGAVVVTAAFVSVPEALFPLATAIALTAIVWLRNKSSFSSH